MTNIKLEGRKDDGDKVRLDLIPVRPLMMLGERYTVGSKKYGDYNWTKGMKWGRVYGALLRHIFKWWAGEKYDTEDNGHHLAAACFCLFTLMEYERINIEGDDRPKNMKGGLK